MQVVTVSQAHANLEKIIDGICRNRAPVLIQSLDGNTVVMISLSDYNGMRETMHLLGSSTNIKRLRASIDELARQRTPAP
jgi:antitoxin YefM